MISRLLSIINNVNLFFALIALATLALLYLIIRLSIIRHYRPLEHSCPKCSGHIIRVHRRLSDRLIDRLFNTSLRRYRCDRCGWTGLRYRSHRRPKKSPTYDRDLMKNNEYVHYKE